jgi:hypothetical protein
MTTFLAGFGRADITPRLGCQLVGYANRPGGATGVHDRLSARALVLEDAGGRWAIISAELCYLNAETVQTIRMAIQQRVNISPAHVFVAASHTHAGPHDGHSENWARPLAEIITDAVESACRRLQPARLGTGYGFLYGYSINRRWLDRPVDPGVAVIRVDDLSGKPLGLVTSFACHAVVLGSDNLLISGDWPGYACTHLEEALGPEAVCLFLQGGCGDINPLVAGVRSHLQGDQTVSAIGQVSTYYGSPDDPQFWNIGDRKGGSLEEVAELGQALAEEVLRVARRLETNASPGPLWSAQQVINAATGLDEFHPEPPAWSLALVTEAPTGLTDDVIPAEIMLLGIGGTLLIGQPGEVFSETAVTLRTRLRTLGYRTPILVGYANGWLVYLPPPEAFDEGGYEPGWAVRLGISRHFQARVWEGVTSMLARR